MPKCLICDKEVIHDIPGLTAVHKGETIYFCSVTCKDKADFSNYPEMRETGSAPGPK